MTPVAQMTKPVRNGNGARRSLVTPLNLHWAGVGLLVLLNVYLVAQMLVLWHRATSYDAQAIEQQQAELRIAQVAAQPLRGLNDKLKAANADADKFYKDRLPHSYSEVAAEIGALAKKDAVRLTGAQYTQATVLPNSPFELTELHIDARLSGDYRPLVQFINALERDKMFFIINGVTLNGQQSGTVNLRLQLTTYLRGGAAAEQTAETAPAVTPAGGPR
jgi:hypothetical protein